MLGKAYLAPGLEETIIWRLLVSEGRRTWLGVHAATY